jgi:hypothetical protein
VLDSPTVIACFDDIAVMCDTIKKRCRHFLVAKHSWPFTECQVGRDDDRGALIEMRKQMENKLSAIF